MFKIGNIEFNEFPLFLSPLENATDFAFRKICKEFGADMMYTEFVSSAAIIREIDRTKEKMYFSEFQRPLGIQIYGSEKEVLVEAAKIAESYMPDLIDINFGCPVKKIACRGAGSGILNDIDKMVDITSAIVKAVKLPVTVKTRLGYDEDNKNIVEITHRLQDVGIQAITIHGRTRSQYFKGEADWTLIGEVKNHPRTFIPVIGNGDIDSEEKALEYQKRYNVDAIMIGRAAIGNPWIFKQIKYYYKNLEKLTLPTLDERVEVCRNHLVEAVGHKGERVALLTLRKHYASYFKYIPNFKAYRYKLVTSESYEEINDVLDNIKLHMNTVSGILESVVISKM